MKKKVKKYITDEGNKSKEIVLEKAKNPSYYVVHSVKLFIQLPQFSIILFFCIIRKIRKFIMLYLLERKL